MRYFKFKEPYYAVIGAESKERALVMYERNIADIIDELEYIEITKEQVIEEWVDAGERLHELVDMVQHEGIYLVSGPLI